VVKKDRGIKIDKDYPYLDRSLGLRIAQAFTRLGLTLIAFPVSIIYIGLRIKGRENIRKHREVLKNGVISCSNHVHMWDFISVRKAVRHFNPNLLAWDRNLNGENGTLIKLVGGIPIPVNDLKASTVFLRVTENLLMDKGWLHIYAEGSMWEYYQPIRPFKPGIGYYSVKTGKPVLPLGFSYREPSWIRKNIFRQPAAITLTVGEPLYPDTSLPKSEREKDLIIRCHREVCRLAGIDPDENIYPPVFDNTKRIDYYPLEAN
jgi:1-acyl-sn-glycerol-3-phosphate acyltransferase